MNIHQPLPRHVHVCQKVLRVPVPHPAPRLRTQTNPSSAPTPCSRSCECRASPSLREPSLQPASQLSDLKLWLSECHGVQQNEIKLLVAAGLYSSTEDFRVTQDVQPGEASQCFLRTWCYSVHFSERCPLVDSLHGHTQSKILPQAKGTPRRFEDRLLNCPRSWSLRGNSLLQGWSRIGVQTVLAAKAPRCYLASKCPACAS